MNTLQTRNVLTKHVKYFQGVYPIDLLTSTIIKPSIFVINVDKHYVPGSHWVAICFSDSGYAEYFDSYGLSPFKYEITAHLQSHSISSTFNRHRLQSLTSNICGYYCCLYAFHKALGQSMTSFVDMFLSAPYTCNDKMAVRFFRAHFKKCPACDQVQQQQQSCKAQI
jgi:hypothetical protein